LPTLAQLEGLQQQTTMLGSLAMSGSTGSVAESRQSAFHPE
jgi:hypothetical protein